MLTLVTRRLLAAIPLLLVVSFAVFGMTYLIPGDAATTLAGGQDASLESIERIRDELNLNAPLYEQYWDWLSGAVRLDFGESLYSGTPVWNELAQRLAPTFTLMALALLLMVPAALLLGLVSGLRPGGGWDRLILLGTSVGISMPSFLMALFLIVVFSVNLGWLPSFGYVPLVESPSGWLRRTILPAAALAASAIAVLTRQLRGSLIQTMQSQYVRTAYAKGGSRATVLWGHALKNAAMPATTVLGVQAAALLGGSIIIEQIFTIPGVGSYMLRAITTQDIPVIQSVTMFFVVINVATNLAVDVAYGFLNPKVRQT